MVIEECLVSLINGGIAALGSRVYPLRIPQNPTYPALAYQRISTPRIMSHDGASKLAMPRIQLTLWASTYSSLKAVSEALRGLLIGYRGTVGGVVIQGIFFDSERDEFDTTTQIFQRFIDLIIHHSEV